MGKVSYAGCIEWVAFATELFLPSACLVCGRKLVRAQLCRRCTPSPQSTPGIIESAVFRCEVCFTPSENLDSCRRCRACSLTARRVARMRFLWGYRDPCARRLIKTMKYRPSPRLARIAGTLAAEILGSEFCFSAYDRIIPIPPSAAALRKRGFSPCLELAHAFCRRAVVSKRKIDSTVLQHNGYRTPQARLRHAQRLTNIDGVFSAKTGALEECSVLLIDDVITTGSTMNAAAAACLDAGAFRVDLLALARAQIWQRYQNACLAPETPVTERSGDSSP